MSRSRLAPLVLSLCVAAASVCLFALLYRFDNKYTAPGPQGVGGVMDLREADPEGYVLLTRGWEFYSGLLAPEDFQTTRFSQVKVIAIGQYAGFEAGDSARSPHGSATYRLQLLLPEQPGSYTLELPEIYSAYRLYIDGVLRMQMGDPDPAAYRPFTGNTAVTFDGAGKVEILLAVTDYSHFYSGLVYPPAFGSPQAVARLLHTRLALRLFCAALAALVGVYHLSTGLLSGKNRLAVLYGLTCLCFGCFTAYPVRGTLAPGGMGWYALENVCFCAMLALVMQVGCSMTGMGRTAKVLSGGAGLFVCACALAVPRMITGNLPLMAFYSGLIGLYTWLAAACLTAASVRGVAGGTDDGRLLLCGIVVFDCALVMDRLLPAFEPIRGGWFIELASGVLVVLLGVAVGRRAVGVAREKLVLEGRIDSISQVVEMQKAQYPVLLESIGQARMLRHDFRHHMRAIHDLAAAGDTQALAAYLSAYGTDAPEPVPSFCQNYVVDTVLRSFSALAHRQQVRFEAQVDVPEEIPVPEADLVSLLSNLLENALEACAHVGQGGQPYVRVAIRQVKDMLGIQVANSYDGVLHTRGDRLLSRKRRGQAGLGTASVRETAGRLGGGAHFQADRQKKEFLCKVRIQLSPQQQGGANENSHL